MADDQDPKAQSSTDVSRRDFVTLSVAAGIALAAGNASGAALPVVETTVEIKTPIPSVTRRNKIAPRPKTATFPTNGTPNSKAPMATIMTRSIEARSR